MDLVTEPTNTRDLTRAEDEAVELCRDLIRIPSVNFGDGSGDGERAAAEFVAGKLSEVGIEPTLYESQPGRTTVVARFEGEDTSRDALLIHGHLDVVPADGTDWTFDPFSAEVHDGCIWGRGAVDMKDMDAMTLAVIREMARTGRKPPRDIVLCFLADEEAGGVYGSHWIAQNHPELFAGVSEAISEVGGFSVTVRDDLRLYLVQTAEKGIAWLRITAHGRAGHGSMRNNENAVVRLAEAVERIGKHEFPIHMTKTLRAFFEALSDVLGVDLDTTDLDEAVAQLGPVANMLSAVLRNTANPTGLKAGGKVNVIPGEATALIDGRFLPGFEENFLEEIDALLGEHVTREFEHRDIAVETSFDGAIVEAMVAAIEAEDPGARTVPYLMSGGTDGKAFSQLGIRNFGFSPLRLPPDLNFAGMFHGVDERVPIDGLKFGVRVLDRFISIS
jgi:acetylornithine deacetylase/succinyl-diaminopimelate desuccinylase-like protein